MWELIKKHFSRRCGNCDYMRMEIANEEGKEYKRCICELDNKWVFTEWKKCRAYRRKRG